ncbi:bifunctional adenosylcobinamide kinase/adenosylcobinamide-phosphate guanylyltransferase [Nakamurella sp. YIM 132087]|uniref:Adenosylcobinamide kinase n=1 Tax=Nakamurella alba TaxID=2665158 RepID=A0A7K1FJN5_9ACTN|nr:bifunctional adenosylcobinamide kinase/adenosylcobinamide-phosphate guanylyltransferase [Nakamurella alba]MTD13074.1 bifunctional adenosylcobinamide kinase/adenosylcobinamide-phosphate guanylyltransferase [Nakamurella alba]
MHQRVPVQRTLVTGGVRSGKSRHAETLLKTSAADRPVTYLAPGPVPDGTDTEWADRIRRHQQRRPAGWVTVECGAEASTALRAVTGPVLLDCLGTWITAVLDGIGAWDRPQPEWEPEVHRRIDDLVRAWSAVRGPAVAVTNEVGWGVVPEHRSGRQFRDLLGTVNQRVAAASDEVHLVVAGRVLVL